MSHSLRKRFPLEEDSFIAMFHSMEPQEATSPERKLKSIIKLAVNLFPFLGVLSISLMNEEWGALTWAKETVHHMLTQEVSTFRTHGWIWVAQV